MDPFTARVSKSFMSWRNCMNRSYSHRLLLLKSVKAVTYGSGSLCFCF